MREFDLVRPRDLGEALEALGAADGGSQALAGGTDMIVNLRARAVLPTRLVALGGLSELCEVRLEDGSLRVGSGVQVSHFLRHPLLLEHAALARAAAAQFANPMIRNLATVGGNIASASPAADLAPPLLALDAQVELASREGTRRIPLDDLFVGPRKTARRPGELITAFVLPTKAAGSAGAFYKLGLRQADAISLVSVAVHLERGGDTCKHARIALGAVAPRPLRARRAEAALEDLPASAAAFAHAADLAAQECSPIDDLRATATYRRRMVRVYVERMLNQAWALDAAG